MAKPILTLMCGLPRSGKTTLVRALSLPTVTPDDIRKELGCYPFVAEMESSVWKIVREQVNNFFATGAHQVVLDATNVTRKRRAAWANPSRYDLMIWHVFTPLTTCLERAVATDQEYLIPIIHRMHSQFQTPTINECQVLIESR